MSSTTVDVLPVHPRTGLRAVGWSRRGPIWPILGAAEDDGSEDADDSGDPGDDPTDAADSDDSGTSDGDDIADAGDDDKPLGPKGERALAAEKQRRRDEAAKRRAAEQRNRELEVELAKLRKGTDPEPGDDEKDASDVEEVRRKAEQDVTAKANERILRAEVRAAATGKLADPADALKFLDLTQFEVGDDGDVDADEIADAIDDLIKNKPYLGAAAQGGKRFKGSGDGGAKPVKPSRPQSLSEAVTRALAPK